MNRLKFHVFLFILFIIPCQCFGDTLGVPVPILAFDPNEGQTIGVILAVVTESEGRINRIMAPAVSRNSLNGLSVDFNYFGFPSDEEKYFLYFSHTTNNFWGYTARYQKLNLWPDWLEFWGEVSFNRSAVNRFYGFGPDSEQEHQSDYTLTEVVADLKLTMSHFSPFKLNFDLCAHPTWISRGQARDIDKLDDHFHNLPGQDGAFVWYPRISLEFDTRDSEVTPTSGLYGEVFLQSSLRELGSDSTFLRFGFEGRGYLSHLERCVLAVRVLTEFLACDDKRVPFYEYSMLGGGKTLRGFGAGRFYDRHKALVNFEERIRIYRWDVANVQLDIEGAVFADVGQVFNTLDSFRLKDTQFVAGAGIRLVVRSQIVAKVDLGFGSEGTAIFAGLDYPF